MAAKKAKQPAKTAKADKDKLSNLSAGELQKRLKDLKQESFNLRLQRSAGTLENTARIRTVRRESARILTAVNATKTA